MVSNETFSNNLHAKFVFALKGQSLEKSAKNLNFHDGKHCTKRLGKFIADIIKKDFLHVPGNHIFYVYKGSLCSFGLV